MEQQGKYRFKAATGFGAVIEGIAEGTDSQSVSRELLKQGLIPTSVWKAEAAPSGLLGRILNGVRGLGRRGSPSVDTAA